VNVTDLLPLATSVADSLAPSLIAVMPPSAASSVLVSDIRILTQRSVENELCKLPGFPPGLIGSPDPLTPSFNQALMPMDYSQNSAHYGLIGSNEITEWSNQHSQLYHVAPAGTSTVHFTQAVDNGSNTGYLNSNRSLHDDQLHV